jgi:hypothetical protein
LRLRFPNDNGGTFRGTAVVCSKFPLLAKAGLEQGRLEGSGMCPRIARVRHGRAAAEAPWFPTLSSP